MLKMIGFWISIIPTWVYIISTVNAVIKSFMCMVFYAYSMRYRTCFTMALDVRLIYFMLSEFYIAVDMHNRILPKTRD